MTLFRVPVKIILAFALSTLVAPAQPTAPQPEENPPPLGSISGVITNAATGAPAAGVPVRVVRSSNPPGVFTDAEGRYKLPNLSPRRYTVSGGSFMTRKYVTLGPGQDLRSVDFLLQPEATISGRVTDENDEPVPGAQVVLLGREYFLGEMSYYRRVSTRADDRGEYHLPRFVAPGTAWLIQASLPNLEMEPVSDEPADPKARRAAMIPTYYPNAPTPEGGAPVTLRPGEQRQGVDIRMARSPSYCVEAHIDLPSRSGERSFRIHETQPSTGMGPRGGAAIVSPGGTVGPDGDIRVCGLHRGDYRLTAFTGNMNIPDSIGNTLVSITDHDVADLTVTPLQSLPLAGRIVWADKPPEDPVEAQPYIVLRPRYRSFGPGPRAQSPVPGAFALRTTSSITGEDRDPFMEEFSVRVIRLPDSVYLQDITYGGTSVLHKPLLLGSAPEGAELRVILNHDGGFLKTRVTDDKGEPVADAHVIIFPKQAASSFALAETRTTGRTDQNGEYTSGALAPGAYYVVATAQDLTDFSPETINKLWNARLKTDEVVIAPGATKELALQPIVIP